MKSKEEKGQKECRKKKKKKRKEKKKKLNRGRCEDKKGGMKWNKEIKEIDWKKKRKRMRERKRKKRKREVTIKNSINSQKRNWFPFVLVWK